MTDNQKELKSYVPEFYDGIYEMDEILKADGVQLDKIDAATKDLLKQFFIESATWGLQFWEETFNIIVDESKPIEERRSVVLSMRRGNGKLSGTKIKNIANAYTNGGAEVELTNRLIIRFTSVQGTPPNLDDLKAVLKVLKPSHINIEYVFKYLLIKDIHNVMTLETLENTTLDKFAF